MTTRYPGRLPLLDALRTIAALGVLFYHTPELFALPLFVRGYLFVDLFFLISGFVLALAFEPKLAAGLAPLAFMRARVRRLWPMMALGSVAGALVFASQTGLGGLLLPLFLSLLFVPLLAGSPTLYPLNAPQWSLLWELAANLLHALLLRRLSDRALLAFALVNAAGLAAAIFYLGCNCFGPNVDFWWLTFPRAIWPYALGAWMARRWVAGWQAGAAPRPLADWRVALALPLAAVMLLPWLPLTAAQGDALAVVVILPLLFWVAATAHWPEESLAGLTRLGSLSFPIYALNMPVVIAFTFWDKSALARLGAVTVTLMLAALVAYTLPRLGLRPGRTQAAKA